MAYLVTSGIRSGLTGFRDKAALAIGALLQTGKAAQLRGFKINSD